MPKVDLTEEVIHEKESKTGDEYVVCVKCKELLANEQDAIEVEGQHIHTRINPIGIEYVIRCFRDAMGCSLAGEQYHADSWFAGYVWQLAECPHCKEHLGWLFSGSDHFYGLIRSRIEIQRI